MNNKNILKFQIFSIIFTATLGTILHFTFNWSNNNDFVGFFSAINESTWEHLKLLFFPMLITTIIGYFYFDTSFPQFICAKILGIISSLLFTVIFFYTYTGIIGTNFAFLNIGSFFVAILIGEYVFYKLLNSKFICNKYISIIILLLLLFCFIYFTLYPPKINLFKDPITNSYGIMTF